MNKELLDKVVSLHIEIDNVNEKIEAIKFAESTLLFEGIDIDKDAISFIRDKYEANLADLQAELNKYEIVDSVPYPITSNKIKILFIIRTPYRTV